MPKLGFAVLLAFVLFALASPVRAAEPKIIYLTHQNNNDPNGSDFCMAEGSFSSGL